VGFRKPTSITKKDIASRTDIDQDVVISSLPEETMSRIAQQTKLDRYIAPKTITITWVESVFEPIPGNYRTDLGERPVMREVKTARSCVWVLEGDLSDLARAQEYAAREGAIVHTFRTSHRDPLGAARAQALSSVA
jgi:hypothetical protein